MVRAQGACRHPEAAAARPGFEFAGASARLGAASTGPGGSSGDRLEPSGSSGDGPAHGTSPGSTSSSKQQAVVGSSQQAVDWFLGLYFC